MPDNKAEIESLITNSPAFQNAARKTDDLLGTNVADRAAAHVQDLHESEDSTSRRKTMEEFMPNSTSSSPQSNVFQQPALKEAFVDPTPSQRSMEVRDNALNAFKNIDSLVDHKSDWAKPMGFSTGENDVDYDRFYYHPNFKKLGYSPFRDNESLYNANSSWWDDFTRMRSQWMGLAGEGFKSMVDQWKNPLDFSPNTDMAKSFEKGMAIAASTKPGFGAKFTNFVGNSGYTVGILGEMVVEEAVLLGATALTGGLDAEITVPGMIGTLARGAAKITRGSARLEEMVKALKETEGTISTISNLNKVDDARNIMNLTKQYGTGAAKFLNPLKNTMEFMSIAGKEVRAAEEIGKGTKTITNLALVSRGVGSFYKDVRMMNAAFAEARLEGGMVKNEQVKKWVGDYYNKNGKLPEGEEAQNITKLATHAGVKTSLINIPMIYYTNELVLGKAFKGWVPGSVAREMEAGTKGVRFLKTGTGKTATYEGVEGLARFKKAAYWKQAPTIIAGDMLRYTSANFAEGAQETIQDVISGSVKDYYNKIYTSPALGGHRQTYASFTKGVGDQFSSQGAETFLSGFFMGALLQGPQNLIYTHGRTAAMIAGEKIRIGTDKEGKAKYMVEPGTMEKLKKEKTDWMNHVANSLTSVAQNPEEYVNALELNMTRQTNLYDTMHRAVSDKDRKTFEDNKTESMFQHFYTLLNSGHFENFIAEIDHLKSLSPEELGEAFNENHAGDNFNKSMHEKLDNVISRAYQIKNHYDEINSRFVDDTNPYLFDPIKEAEQFKNAKRRQVAFREAKMHASFGDYAFNDALKRMSSISEDAVGIHKPLSKASSTAISVLFDFHRQDGALSQEIQTLTKQAETFKGSTPENESKIPQIKAKVAALKKLQSQMMRYDSVFELQRNGKAVPEEIIKASENAITDLHAAYKDYLKILADETGESLLDKNIPASFSGITDFIELNRESKNMARFVNYLHDPANFLKYVDTFDDELAKQLENWHIANKEALSKYIGRQDMNVFINILFDKGVFLDPASIDDLAAHKYENLEFLNATTGGPLDKTSDKYLNEIKPIVDLFIDVEKEMTDETPEASIVSETPVEDVVQPTREQVTKATKLLGGISFQLKQGRTTSYNTEAKKWEFRNRNGKLITNRKQIDKLSVELSRMPGIIRIWWTEQISNEDRDIIRKDFDRLFDIFQSGQAQAEEFARTPEFVVLEALQGAKFKPNTDVDKNTTDINKKVWISEDGYSVDQFAESIMDDLAEAGGSSLDEQDIINMIYDAVNANPEGIKKKDLENYKEEKNSTRDLIELSELFAHTYGLDIQRVHLKLDELNLLEYESKRETGRNEEAPADNEYPTGEEDMGVPTEMEEEPAPEEEPEVRSGNLTEIPETEDAPQDSEEIRALRDAAAAKVTDPKEKLDILLGKRDNELYDQTTQPSGKPIKIENLKKGDVILDPTGGEHIVVSYDPGSSPEWASDENVMMPGEPETLTTKDSTGKTHHYFDEELAYFTEKTTALPKTKSTEQQLYEAQNDYEWAKENGDTDAMMMYKAVAEDLRASLPKTEKKTSTRVPLAEQIANAQTTNALITIRQKVVKGLQTDPTYVKRINVAEFEKLYNLRLEQLVKSVTFANISKGDFLIMNNRKNFPTGVAEVKFKGKDYIQVRAIREDGTPDSFSSVQIESKDLKKSVKNIYSETMAKETEAPIDSVTKELSSQNQKNETKLSDGAAMQKAMRNADNKQIEDLLKDLGEEDKNC
jgi:hypothetical protein